MRISHSGHSEISFGSGHTRAITCHMRAGPISGVTVYFIPRIFYPGDSIYYPADSISLVYFIPRQDILSLHGDQGMSQNISVATQSSSPAVSQCSLNSSYGMYCHRGEI